MNALSAQATSSHEQTNVPTTRSHEQATQDGISLRDWPRGVVYGIAVGEICVAAGCATGKACLECCEPE